MEEKEKAIEPNQEPENNVSIEDLQKRIAELEERNRKQKSSMDNAMSDAADWKKKFRATQDEQERIKAEQAEKLAEQEKLLAEYQKKEKVASYNASYLALGYDKDLASSAAEAMAEGDFTKMFEIQQKFNDAQKKKFAVTSLDKQPELTPGKTPQSDALNDLSDEEYYKAVYKK